MRRGRFLRRKAADVLSTVYSLRCVAGIRARLFPLDFSVRSVDPERDLDGLGRMGTFLMPWMRGRMREVFRHELTADRFDEGVFLVAVDRRRQRNVLGLVRARHGANEREWRVWGLEVTPLCWRRGVGRALMTELISMIRARGADRVVLSLDGAASVAREFYRRLGFEPAGHSTEALERGVNALGPG
jgi:ribosomal protein S18 acetylase RimI-like enzyme